MLTSTDFAVGMLVQPLFIAVLITFLLDEPSGYCVLRVVSPVIVGVTRTLLYHLALISGERYLAMKHPFAYSTQVTEARLLVASSLATVQQPTRIVTVYIIVIAFKILTSRITL